MKMNKSAGKIIKKLIKESNLPWRDRYEAEILLEQALRSKENQETREIIEVLEDLYKDLKDPEIFTSEYLAPRYQDVVMEAIKEYKLKVRKNDCVLNTNYFQPFDDYTPITFEKLLGSLCKEGTKIETTEDGKIIFIPHDPDILEREIKHAEDDGGGYAPKGFQEVFTSYQDREDKNIYLWT